MNTDQALTSLTSLDIMANVEVKQEVDMDHCVPDIGGDPSTMKTSPKFTSQISSVCLSSPPPILRRGKYKRRQGKSLAEELENVLHELEDSPRANMDTTPPRKTHVHLSPPPRTLGQLPTTPTHTPIKNLPFSPSQFLNGSSSSSKLTSTPNGPLKNTPGHPHNSTPRTPTPFKAAIQEAERMAKSKNWSPGGMDDLGEMLRECDPHDPGYDADMSHGLTPHGMTHQDHRETYRLNKRKPNKEVSSDCLQITHNRRVSQSLEQRFSQEDSHHSDSILHSPETPSKSLVGDTSLLLSPPSIIKDTLPEDMEEVYSLPKKTQSSGKTTHTIGKKPHRKTAKKIVFSDSPPKQHAKIDQDYREVACGLTRDQQDMTSLAKMYL